MAESPDGLILIVTGSTLRAEQMDRPLAYYLQAKIDELGAGQADRMALVLSDRYYLTHPDLQRVPTISVGGPGVNRVAQKLLKKLHAILEVEGKFFVQMDQRGEALRASIWGIDNAQTRIAVVTFVERYLCRFVKLCWQRAE